MEIKLTGELASRLSGKTIEVLKAELYEEDGTTLKEDYQDVFMDFVTEKFQKVGKDNFSRGFKKKGKDIEKAFLPVFEKHSISLSDFDTFEEALSSLTEKMEEDPIKIDDPSTIDKETLRKLPAFQELLNESVQAKDKLFNDLKSEYNEYKTTKENEDFSKKIETSWLNSLTAKGVNARFNGETLEDQLNDIRFHIKAIGVKAFGKNENGEPVPIDTDGNQLRDNAANLISMGDFVKSNWKLGFDAVDPNRNFPPGTKKKDKGGGSSLSITSNEEFEQAMNRAAGDPEKRLKIREAWSEHLQSAEEK